MTTPMQNIITPVQEAEQAHGTQLAMFLPDTRLRHRSVLAIGPIHLKPVLPSHNPRYSRPEQ